MAEIDLTKMTSAELVKALIKDNLLASEFDRLNLWEEFDSDYWCELLSAQPQFTEKAKEYSSGWVGLLQIKPELANECECWEKFSSWDCSELLSAQPQFVDKCAEYKVWEKFDLDCWCELLKANHNLPTSVLNIKAGKSLRIGNGLAFYPSSLNSGYIVQKNRSVK